MLDKRRWRKKKKGQVKGEVKDDVKDDEWGRRGRNPGTMESAEAYRNTLLKGHRVIEAEKRRSLEPGHFRPEAAELLRLVAPLIQHKRDARRTRIVRVLKELLGW